MSQHPTLEEEVAELDRLEAEFRASQAENKTAPADNSDLPLTPPPRRVPFGLFIKTLLRSERKAWRHVFFCGLSLALLRLFPVPFELLAYIPKLNSETTATVVNSVKQRNDLFLSEIKFSHKTKDIRTSVYTNVKLPRGKSVTISNFKLYPKIAGPVPAYIRHDGWLFLLLLFCVFYFGKRALPLAAALRQAMTELSLLRSGTAISCEYDNIFPVIVGYELRVPVRHYEYSYRFLPEGSDKHCFATRMSSQELILMPSCFVLFNQNNPDKAAVFGLPGSELDITPEGNLRSSGIWEPVRFMAWPATSAAILLAGLYLSLTGF